MKAFLMLGVLVAGLGAAAFAQGTPPTHIRGVVVSLDGSVLTVGAPIGTATTTVTLAPNVRVSYIVKSSLAAIVPGTYIGTAAVPQTDGTLRAIEVYIFPPNVKPAAGTKPWDLTPTSMMTNGTVETIGTTTVDNVAAGLLTVTYDGGSQKVTVPPSAPVVASEPADISALVKGAHVNFFAVKAADGSFTAGSVSVGKDGLVPPM